MGDRLKKRQSDPESEVTDDFQPPRTSVKKSGAGPDEIRLDVDDTPVEKDAKNGDEQGAEEQGAEQGPFEGNVRSVQEV